MYACLSVASHLHIWQNGRGLLRATAVTRVWKTPNKSQHRKLNLFSPNSKCLTFVSCFSNRLQGSSTISNPLNLMNSCQGYFCYLRPAGSHDGIITSHPVLSNTVDTHRLSLKKGYELLNKSFNYDRIDFAASESFRLEKKLLSIMDERALASTLPLDMSNEPSVEHSTLHMVGRGTDSNADQYSRDTVTVRLDLKDSGGRPVHTGGHQIRMWMADEDSRRSAALHVTDMRNGSYVTSFPVLWSGRTIVHAALLFSRDLHYVMMKTILRLKTPQPQVGAFIRGRVEQATLCGPFPVVPGFPVTCNLTSLNSGLDWFCGKPTKASLRCTDWRLSRSITNRGYPRPWQSDREQLLVNRFKQR